MSGSDRAADEPDRTRSGSTDHVDLVADLLFGIERAEIDLPHIVLSRHASGDVSYSGPYDSGLSALRAAELEHTIEVAAGGDGEITFHVAALYPPLDAERRPPAGRPDGPP
jgi:hypothetical protein